MTSTDHGGPMSSGGRPVAAGVQPDAPDKVPHMVILPRRGLITMRPREVWEYRDVFWQLSRRDLTLRYRQTALGVIWVILQPVLNALIFSFVFGKVAHIKTEGVPYFLFSYAGLLVWTAFSGTWSQASASVLASAPMVTKVFFPRVLLPLEVMSAAVINALVGVAFLLIAMPFFKGHPPYTWHMVTFPFWLLLGLLMGEGLGQLGAVLTVRYRDVQYVLPVIISMLLYITPIAYPVSAVPKSLRFIVNINPLTGIIEGTRWALVGGTTFHLQWGLTIYSVIMTVVALIIGAIVFGGFEKSLADVI